MLSFRMMGMPWRGPRGPVVRRSRSSAAACSRALGLVSMTARRVGPCRLTSSILAKYAYAQIAPSMLCRIHGGSTVPTLTRSTLVNRPFCRPSCSSVIDASYKSGNCVAAAAGARAASWLKPNPAHAKARKRAKREATVNRIVSKLELLEAFTAGRSRPPSGRRWSKDISEAFLSTLRICVPLRVGSDFECHNNNNSNFPRSNAAKEVIEVCEWPSAAEQAQ